MKLLHSSPRFVHLVASGGLMIAFYTGSACSRNVERVFIQPESGLESSAPGQDLADEEIHKKPRDPVDLRPPDAAAHEDEDVEERKQPNGQVLALESELKALRARNQEYIAKVLSLYRRLHIELDDAGRSALIVELLSDHRIEVQRLGFELVDRDLSGSTVLDPQVGERAMEMLSEPDPEIRSKAARLITRLVPPNAMEALAESLSKEQDPVAAEPMLLGVARWPSPEAVGPVLRWFLRADAPFSAACSAAWAIEQAGLWDDPETQHLLLMERLRQVDPKALHEAGMKLIARLGNASDLRELVTLLLSENPDQQQWAAAALVETPRAVEVLVQAGEENKKLFAAASDSLIRHRATPDGLRRLASLPYPDEQSRTAAIERMGLAIDTDRLAAAVQLADLDPTRSALLLSRLLNSNIEITPQVATGIVRLAEIELGEQRPNRALEAAIALDDASLDPIQQATILRIKAESLIVLGKMSDAYVINTDPQVWMAMIEHTEDLELRRRIASFMLKSFGEALSPEQRTQLDDLQIEDNTNKDTPSPASDGG